MLHYYPRQVSSINMPIFRRTNCIHTASGIVALCKRLHSTPVESRLQSSVTYILLMNKELCIKVGKLNNSELLYEICNLSVQRFKTVHIGALLLAMTQNCNSYKNEKCIIEYSSHGCGYIYNECFH